jgi:3-oxoacyl-[acyl-carrier protein] reductase
MHRLASMYRWAEGQTMDFGLQGKTAMVAAASRGLGYAVARQLALEGANLSIVSRDPAAIEDAAQRIRGESDSQVLSMTLDVRSAEGIEQWRDATVERFGGVDALFTNSGGPPPGAFLNFGDDAWQDGFELLVLSVVRMTRAVIPIMRAGGGGAILMSTSSSVKEPIQGLTLSTVLRASVSALAKTLAQELARDGIRVNQLIPGSIATDRIIQLASQRAAHLGISLEEQRRQAEAGIPMGRYGEPDEYGRAGAFLLSDAASYITGATLQVDGGVIHSIV